MHKKILCVVIYIVIFGERKEDFTMKKENYARKGFTLVELLIVIVVIGILSAMMMLSSTEAMSSAKASNIVSNLRNLKTATLAWYADHVDLVSLDLSVTDGLSSHNDEILKYFNNEGSITLKGNDAGGGSYSIVSSTNGKNSSNVWYIGYVFSDADKTSVREKLAGRAKSLGLKFGGNGSSLGTLSTTDYSSANAVWLLVLGTPNS